MRKKRKATPSPVAKPLADRFQQLLLTVLLGQYVLVGPSVSVSNGLAPRSLGYQRYDVRSMRL